MAKDKAENKADEPKVEAQKGPTLVKKPEAEQAEKAPSVGRAIVIKDPDSGDDIKRVDWIRRVFQDAESEYYCSRSKIAAKLTEIQGKPVPYQIVFAATKDFKVERPPKPVVAKPAAGGDNSDSGSDDPLEGAETA